MKEYNWREEREKFRPEFRKSKETPETPVEPSADWRKIVAAVLSLLVGCALIAAIVFWAKGCKNTQKENGSTQLAQIAPKEDSATQLAQVAEKNKDAVGLVVLTVELQNGKKFTQPIGTAWAFAENKFATNAHVALGLREALQETEKVIAQQAAGTQIRQAHAEIIINGSHDKRYVITQVQIHPGYGVMNSNYDPDVAVLTINGRHEQYFKLADAKVFAGIKSGVPVAFLGFPMENLLNDNVNISNPVASMQSGIVVAVTDFDLRDAGPSGNVLIRHNLPATGGASGSPIFNCNGEVIALLYAINVVGQVQQAEKGVQITRAPSGAMINMAIRSDVLAGVGAPVAISDFLN